MTSSTGWSSLTWQSFSRGLDGCLKLLTDLWIDLCEILVEYHLNVDVSCLSLWISFLFHLIFLISLSFLHSCCEFSSWTCQSRASAGPPLGLGHGRNRGPQSQNCGTAIQGWAANMLGSSDWLHRGRRPPSVCVDWKKKLSRIENNRIEQKIIEESTHSYFIMCMASASCVKLKA